MKCTYLIFKIWGCFILRTSLRRIYAQLDSVGTTFRLEYLTMKLLHASQRQGRPNVIAKEVRLKQSLSLEDQVMFYVNLLKKSLSLLFFSIFLFH